MDRKQLGQQQLGVPVSAAFDALVDVIDQKDWSDFNREPVGYYFSKMVGGWFLRMADSGLSDAQLQAVKPAEVYTTLLSLFRDMFRHNSALLRPKTTDADWVEPLFKEIANNVGLPLEAIKDDGHSYDIENMGNCGWAKPLGAPFNIAAQKLFACHSAIVTGAAEEFGDAE